MPGRIDASACGFLSQILFSILVVAQARLIFAERIDSASHLARHRLAGLFLDTLPINAHATASYALWGGVPVLTCKGKAFPRRFNKRGVGCSNQMGA